MSATASALSKSAINKIDELFCLAAPESEDKVEFSNEQKKLRIRLVQEMRQFKEHLDGLANKRLSEKHASSQRQQELKGSNAVSALKLLCHIYYLK